LKPTLLATFCFVLIATCCPTLLLGQNLVVSGVVHDASGARIGRAHVVVHGGTVSAAQMGETGEQGEFRFEVPSAGRLQIDVSAVGFKVLKTQAILSEQVPAAKLDLTLEVAENSETMDVSADALAAETTSTQLGETLGSGKIEGVPLNGRNFTDLMAVQPGIVPSNTGQPGAVIMTGVAATPPSGDANPGNLSINGQRESSNGFRVNGSDAEEDVNMGTSIVPNLDSIDSFRVLTSNFDAEYGNSSGGQVLVVTKSGSAAWHGSAFEFLRNTALDARNYYSKDRAAYRQNQFGGTIGGAPIRGKNLFLFGDYQGTRLTEGIDTGNIAVPTKAERGGDFSQVPLTGSVNGTAWATQLSTLLGRSVTAGEAYSAVFPDGSIPQTAWSAPANHLLDSIPQQNVGDGLFATSAEAETLRDDKGALRLDWTHGRATMTAYYFVDQYSLDNPYPTGTGGASVPGFDATSDGLAQLLSLADVRPIGEASLNQIHLSYMRNANAVGQPKGGVGPSLESQGFSTGTDGIVAMKPSTVGIENVAFNDFTMGVDTTAIVQAENIYEASDAFSRIVGRHGLKFGAEFHANQINTHPDVIFNGSFGFNGSETGVDFADFLLGVPSSYTQGQARSFYNRNLYIAAFAQDSWRASAQLTVNYGVRWDRIRPWDEKFNQLQTLVEGEQSVVYPGAPLGLVFPGDPGVPRSLAPARNNFSPRIGLAYSPAVADDSWLSKLIGPAGQTSIRTGYGIFYTAYEGLSAGIMSANPPYGYTYTSAAPPLFASPFTVAATGVSAKQRFPLQSVAYGASRAHPNNSVDWSQFEPLVGIPAVDPRDVTPYAEHWMVSVERRFGTDTLLNLSYIGAGAHHLLALEEENPADPALCLSLGSNACGPFNEQTTRKRFGSAFGSVELQRTIANSSYHALEATLNHRTHGLDLLASYTYSKSIDQSAGLPEPVNPVNPSLSRGLSSFDMRHNFVTSFHYTLPRMNAGRLNWLTNGWAVAGIVRLTSGLPVTLVNNNDTSLLGTIPNGINNNGVDTPTWSGRSLRLNRNPRSGAAAFDASQLTLPALGTMGNARRRFFSGPGMESIDATLSRTLLVEGSHALEVRVEAFNLLNHAQFFGAASVEGNISSGSFGQAVSAMSPRLMQVALRYRF